MRYMGIDLGTKTCGIAISDKTNIMACPLKTLKFEENNYKYLATQLDLMMDMLSITDLAVGYPKNMDGTSGFATERFEKLKKYIKYKVNIHYIDERLSTLQAKAIFRTNGRSERSFRNEIDTLSAVLILEVFMRKMENER